METEQRANHGDGRRRDHTRLNIWVTFAGAVLAALIGGIFALLAARADKPAATATVAPESRQPTASRTSPVPVPAPTTEATAAGWSGPVTVQGFGTTDVVDLDLRPPRAIDNTSRDGDVNVDYLRSGKADVGKAAFANSSFAVWSQEDAPQFAQCNDVALSQGVGKVGGVVAGDVLCVRTTEDRIARLVVKKIDTRQDTVTFDATVWDNS